MSKSLYNIYVFPHFTMPMAKMICANYSDQPLNFFNKFYYTLW